MYNTGRFYVQTISRADLAEAHQLIPLTPPLTQPHVIQLLSCSLVTWHHELSLLSDDPGRVYRFTGCYPWRHGRGEWYAVTYRNNLRSIFKSTYFYIPCPHVSLGWLQKFGWPGHAVIDLMPSIKCVWPENKTEKRDEWDKILLSQYCTVQKAGI